MEPMTWFGTFGPSFGLPMAILAAIAALTGLTSTMLSITRSSPRGAFFTGTTIAVLILVGVVFALIMDFLRPGESGFTADTWMTIAQVLIVILGVTLFMAMLSWTTSSILDDPPAILSSIFRLSLKGLALLVVLWLILTFLFAGAEHREWLATIGDMETVPTSGEIAMHRVESVLQGHGVLAAIIARFTPVWIALVTLFALSLIYKRRLGLYGKLFDSPIGMIGFVLVMFWVFTGIFAAFGMIGTHEPLEFISGMKNALPGTPVPDGNEGFRVYLLGGDHLARDVFSRLISGSWIVVQIAPLATLFAFMVGITLGLPAGYYGGRLDTILSFSSNLILAFPVILLFYLLVTPEIVATGIPNYLAVVLFVFPLVFAGVLINSRFYTDPPRRNMLLIVILGLMGWLYLSTVSAQGTKVHIIPNFIDGFNIPAGILVVFVSVVFVNSPTVFRIVRGLTMDVKTRDYVAAAQTRGEGPWYIMLWEILPNVRGPLIVDFCLRIGYTTILLGTLGFFGLGLSPESPDWGSTINAGRQNLLFNIYPPLPPAIALLTLVLGLNLLADGLREESLKD